MKSCVIKKDNYIIKDLNDWKEYAGPVDPETQWVDKRSAKEFAQYMLSVPNCLPTEIETLVSQVSSSDQFALYPEFLTGFSSYGMGSRGPRHHDGLLVGNDIVIGIEAKADEELDKHFLSEYDSTKDRYRIISQLIFGDSPSNHTDIRYQLVSSTMGTLIEAYERHVSNAMLLIISFVSKEKTTKANLDRNSHDIETFKRALISNGNDEYETPFSKEHGIKFYVKHLTIDLDHQKQYS